MNLIALGSYFSDRSDAQAMNKLPLYANIAAIAVKGIENVVQGIRKQKLDQAMGGASTCGTRSCKHCSDCIFRS